MIILKFEYIFCDLHKSSVSSEKVFTKELSKAFMSQGTGDMVHSTGMLLNCN